MSQVERSNFRKKKITGWFRWFAFKFVTNCRLPKNNHPELVLGKQMSPRVRHSEELVEEPKEGPTLPHTPAEATGWSAHPKRGCRGSFGTGPWGVAPSAAAEGPWARDPGVSLAGRRSRRVSPARTSVSAVIFFFNVKIPLKILFVESTRY